MYEDGPDSPTTNITTIPMIARTKKVALTLRVEPHSAVCFQLILHLDRDVEWPTTVKFQFADVSVSNGTVSAV